MSSISQQLNKRNRIAAIEEQINARLVDLFYQMHWEENLMHRQIAASIGIPRPTVTRWFSQMNVPSQPSERITKQYLTSWLTKSGQRKVKPRYVGPNRSSQEYRGNVDIQFFKKWTPDMAYVLGYFAADGSVATNSRGAHYIHFDSIDRIQLETVRAILRSKHVIGVRRRARRNWKTCYRLQIGSRQMFQDLVRLGLGLRKGRRLRIPKMPSAFLPDFVRGFFDGDGGICYGAYARRNRPGKTRSISARFTSESMAFLRSLRTILKAHAGMGKGSLTDDHGYGRLEYSVRDCRRLFKYIYRSADCSKGPFLLRKHTKFSRGLQFCNLSEGAVA